MRQVVLKKQLHDKKKILQDNDSSLKDNIKKIKDMEALNNEKKLHLNQMESENNKVIKTKEEELNHLKSKTSRLFDHLIPEIKSLKMKNNICCYHTHTSSMKQRIK